MNNEEMNKIMTAAKKRQIEEELKLQRIEDASEGISDTLHARLTVLTAVINEASITSTLVGVGLLLMGAATWAIFFMEIGKLIAGSKFFEAIFGVIGAVIAVVIIFVFKRGLFPGNKENSQDSTPGAKG